MSINGSTTISLEGHIYTVFNEACDKLGVDSETLAMMAISGFLNSPLVSGEPKERSSTTIDSISAFMILRICWQSGAFPLAMGRSDYGVLSLAQNMPID